MAYTSTNIFLGTSYVGVGYLGDTEIVYNPFNVPTYSFRNDPYSASLVFATPGALFPTLGMTGSWDDVSATIRGTGVNKTVNTTGIQATSTYIKFPTDGYPTSTVVSGSGSTPSNPIYNADNTDFEFGAGNLTIECWILFTGTPKRMIFDKYTPGNVGASEMFASIGSNTANAMAWAYDGSGSETFFQSAAQTWTSGTWYHVAWVRNGSSSFVMYKDGVSVATSTTNRTLNTTATQAYLMGGTYTPSTSDSWIQDYRIYKGVAKYTSNFTPPSSMVIST